MIGAIKHKAKATATHAAQTAALGFVATIALVVGLGFMTLAGWLVLVTMTTPLYAALALGSFYVGLSLVILVVLSLRKGPADRAEALHAASPPKPAGTMDELVMAFLAGITAGQKARS